MNSFAWFLLGDLVSGEPCTERKKALNVITFLLTPLKNEFKNGIKVIFSHNRCEVKGKMIVSKAHQYYLSFLKMTAGDK